MIREDLTPKAEDQSQQVLIGDLDNEPTERDYLDERLALENTDLKNKINVKSHPRMALLNLSPG